MKRKTIIPIISRFGENPVRALTLGLAVLTAVLTPAAHAVEAPPHKISAANLSVTSKMTPATPRIL